jgi:hypothetical protein
MGFTYKLPVEEMQAACQGYELLAKTEGAPGILDPMTEAICDSLFPYMSSDNADHEYATAGLILLYAYAGFDGVIAMDAPIRESQLVAGMVVGHIAIQQACWPEQTALIAPTYMRGAFRAVALREAEEQADKKRSAARKGIDRWREPVRALVIERFEAAGGAWSASRFAREVSPEVLQLAKRHGRTMSPYNVEGTIRKMVAAHRKSKS